MSAAGPTGSSSPSSRDSRVAQREEQRHKSESKRRRGFEPLHANRNPKTAFTCHKEQGRVQAPLLVLKGF